MIWWTENIVSSSMMFTQIIASLILFTDASLTGWGCSCEIGRTGGHWDYIEAQSNINGLELKAALRALQSFANEKANIHV